MLWLFVCLCKDFICDHKNAGMTLCHFMGNNTARKKELFSSQMHLLSSAIILHCGIEQHFGAFQSFNEDIFDLKLLWRQTCQQKDRV